MPVDLPSLTDIADHDSGIGNFDLELIQDPHHSKRYRHLHGIAVATGFDLSRAENDHRYAKAHWELYFGALALVLAVLINSLLSRWMLFILPAPVEKPLSVVFKPAVSLPKPPPETDAPSNAEAVSINDPKSGSVDSVETLEHAPREEALDDTPAINLKDQIESIVREMEPKTAIPLQDGLSAPGVIVDGHLRQQLNSLEVAKLNRWRVPENALISSPGGRSVTKIGELCILTGLAAQGGPVVELPLVGNGWNLNYYRRVDCHLYFSAPTLNRGSLGYQPPDESDDAQ